MAEDKADKPNLIQRILRIDPVEQRKKLEAAQGGLREAIELKEKMIRAVDDQTKQIKAAAATNLAANRAELERAREQRAHQLKLLDSVTDLAVLSKATHANSADIAGRMCINKWGDRYGTVVYAYTNIDPSQIQDLSTRITEQQNLFSALGADEQAKAKAEFASAKGTTAAIGTYKDFLKSEALGERFKELKQSSPTPK